MIGAEPPRGVVPSARLFRIQPPELRRVVVEDAPGDLDGQVEVHVVFTDQAGEGSRHEATRYPERRETALGEAVVTPQANILLMGTVSIHDLRAFRYADGETWCSQQPFR